MALILFWNAATAADLMTDYDVAIQGVPDAHVRADIESAARTVTLKDRPPASLGLLRRRADDDIPVVLQVLKSYGYYGASVSVLVDGTGRPPRVTFQVVSGLPYRLTSVRIELVGKEEPSIKTPSPADLKLQFEEPAIAAQILEARGRLLREIRNQGYPFAKVAATRVVVDHALQGVAVTFEIDPGPSGHFGISRLVGAQSVDEEFLRGKIPWHTGDRFKADLLAEMRDRLVKTGLFALVQVTHPDHLDAEGSLPITIEVRERKQRTVSAGLSYYTDEGPGANLSWEHRDVFHRGERLRLSAAVSGITLAGDALFEKPEFLRSDQSLFLRSRAARDSTDAYISRNLETSAQVERNLGGGIKVGTGPALRWSRVDQQETIHSYSLLSLPSYLNWDTSNSLLNPTRGGRLAFQVTPFTDTVATNGSFLKGYMSYSHYLSLTQSPALLLAGRTALGAMGGVATDSIPADVRFYAGGGGSIRGYSFQSVGPVVDGKPVGGRSLAEFNAELRLMVAEDVGLVTFLDGGSVFDSAYPSFEERLLWGAGVGLRYFTKIGPLRVDVATPLNRREGMDSRFQVYISLGQAF